MSKEEILINILTRTSNRPIGFLNNYHSVSNQTYKNINHLVSYEYEEDLKHYQEICNVINDYK